jgi:hypothetical protein
MGNLDYLEASKPALRAAYKGGDKATAAAVRQLEAAAESMSPATFREAVDEVVQRHPSPTPGGKSKAGKEPFERETRRAEKRKLRRRFERWGGRPRPKATRGTRSALRKGSGLLGAGRSPGFWGRAAKFGGAPLTYGLLGFELLRLLRGPANREGEMAEMLASMLPTAGAMGGGGFENLMLRDEASQAEALAGIAGAEARGVEAMQRQMTNELAPLLAGRQSVLEQVGQMPETGLANYLARAGVF